MQTLATCAHTHLPSVLGREADGARAQLLSAAQLLLPQLLSTYHATLHPEDRACLLALRALDAVLVGPSQPGSASSPEGKAVEREGGGGGSGWGAGGLMSSAAFVWGKLWGCVQRSAVVTPAAMRLSASRPDAVDPRCDAAAATDSPSASTHRPCPGTCTSGIRSPSRRVGCGLRAGLPLHKGMPSC